MVQSTADSACFVCITSAGGVAIVASVNLKGAAMMCSSFPVASSCGQRRVSKSLNVDSPVSSVGFVRTAVVPDAGLATLT